MSSLMAAAEALHSVRDRPARRPSKVKSRRSHSSSSSASSSDSASDTDSHSSSSGARKRRGRSQSPPAKKKAKKTAEAKESQENAHTATTGHAASSAAANRFNKGLRHFSVMVCEKLAVQGVSTYNEIADQLVAENRLEAEQMAMAAAGLSQSDAASHGIVGLSNYDEKNIRRRIYDALNVLMAMNILEKEKKAIRWKGINFGQTSEPKGPEDARLSAQRDRVSEKCDTLIELTLQYIATRALIEKNKRRPNEVDKLAFPFVLVNTKNSTEIECQMDPPRSVVKFHFSDCFCLHDERVLLQAIALATSQYKQLIPTEIKAVIDNLLPPAASEPANHAAPTAPLAFSSIHHQSASAASKGVDEAAALAANIQEHFSAKPSFTFAAAALAPFPEEAAPRFAPPLFPQSHSPQHATALPLPAYGASPSASSPSLFGLAAFSPSPAPLRPAPVGGLPAPHSAARLFGPPPLSAPLRRADSGAAARPASSPSQSPALTATQPAPFPEPNIIAASKSSSSISASFFSGLTAAGPSKFTVEAPQSAGPTSNSG